MLQVCGVMGGGTIGGPEMETARERWGMVYFSCCRAMVFWILAVAIIIVEVRSSWRRRESLMLVSRGNMEVR